MPNIEIWDPFREMRKLRRTFFGDFDLPTDFNNNGRQPLIDILDKGKEFEVVAELPGVDKKDIDLEVEHSSLNLKAEIENKIEEENKDDGYYYKERSYSSFCRNIPLPDEVIPEKAEAVFKNGVLKIVLPKKNPLENKEIKTKVDIK